MALYKRGDVWWYSFVYAGKRIQESTKTSRKTIATEAEKRRRLELERAHSGLPTGDVTKRIQSVKDVVEPYLKHYGINHRRQSLRFATGRLDNVKRLLGAVLLSDLTQDRIREYITVRLKEGVSGRTVNMECGELSRAMGTPWSILWPKVRKLEERKDVVPCLDQTNLISRVKSVIRRGGARIPVRSQGQGPAVDRPVRAKPPRGSPAEHCATDRLTAPGSLKQSTCQPPRGLLPMALVQHPLNSFNY